MYSLYEWTSGLYISVKYSVINTDTYFVAEQQAMHPGWGKLCVWLCHVVHGLGEWPVQKEGPSHLGIVLEWASLPCGEFGCKTAQKGLAYLGY